VRERYNLDDQVVDGRIILKLIFKQWNGGMDYIDVAQYRDGCGAPVNALWAFGFHKMRRIS
jgi:hypothetical protein